MNLPTILIGLIIGALLVLAIRFLVKNGACAACGDKAACQAARKSAGSAAPTACGGKCSSCKYYEAELKAAEEKQQSDSVIKRQRS